VSRSNADDAAAGPARSGEATPAASLAAVKPRPPAGSGLPREFGSACACHSLSPLPRPAFPRVRLLPGQACCALCIMHSIKREAMGEILIGSLGGTIAMVEESEGGGAL